MAGEGSHRLCKKKKTKIPNCHLRGCISFECFQFHKQEKECSAIPDNWLFSSSASYSLEKLRREIIFEESGPLRSCRRHETHLETITFKSLVIKAGFNVWWGLPT